MNMNNNIFNQIKRSAEDMKRAGQEGSCPVCWGYQQYDGKIRKLHKDKQVDVNNHRDRYMLIQQFIKRHLDTITLREGEILQCHSCVKHGQR